MGETKKLVIVVISILVILLITIPIFVENTSTSNTIVKAVNELFTLDETNVVFLGRDDCTYSNRLTPIMEKLAGYYDFEYKFINTNDLKKNHLNRVLDKLTLDKDDFATPVLVIISKGEIKRILIGYEEEKTIFDFLQQHGVIDSETVYKSDADRYGSVDFITYSDYTNLLNAGEKFVLTIGQDGCAYCEYAKEGMNNIIKEKNKKMYYLNLSNLTAEDEEGFINSLDYFTDKTTWGTPIMFIIENKQVIADLSGYQNETYYRDFLKTNNIID